MKKLLKNKKKLILIGLLVLAGIMILPHLGLAATPDGTQPTAEGTPITSGKIEEKYTEIISFLNVVIAFLQRIFWPVLLMIGGLLKNDLLFGAGMEETMLKIWVNIRNLVNILFVLVILAIAFYNVVGAGEDYHIKKMLPKFIIALVAVNFSFVGIKVIIDGVNVLTTAIFSLPGVVEVEMKKDSIDFEKGICESALGKPPKAIPAPPPPKEGEAQKEQQSFCTYNSITQKYEFTNKAKVFFNKYDSHNAAIVLAFNLGNVAKLDEVKLSAPKIKDLAINMLFSAVLYIVYAISFIALLILLFARLALLWVAIVLSPLVAIKVVLPDSIQSQLGGNGMVEKFVKTVIVPIPIALFMSIGFIMLQALKSADFGNLNLGESTLAINLLTSGMGTLQDLIVAGGVISVVWLGVFAAAEGAAGGEIVGQLKGAAEGAGKWIATAPIKYARIIPMNIGGKEGEAAQPVSLAGAMEAMRRIPGKYSQQAGKDADRIVGGHDTQGINKAIKDLEKADSAQKTFQAASNMSQYRFNEQQSKEAQRELFKKLKDSEIELKMKFPEKIEEMEWPEFKKKMQKGALSSSAFKTYIDKVPSLTGTPPKTMTLPGTTPPGSPATNVVTNAAGGLALLEAKHAGVRIKALSPKQQGTLSPLKIPGGASDTKKVKAAKDGLEALQDIETEAKSTRTVFELAQNNSSEEGIKNAVTPMASSLMRRIRAHTPTISDRELMTQIYTTIKTALPDNLTEAEEGNVKAGIETVVKGNKVVTPKPQPPLNNPPPNKKT